MQDGIILSPETFDRHDAAARAIEGMRGVSRTGHGGIAVPPPPPQTEGQTPGPRLGIIQSAGPNGEADYTDARYWIKTARVTHYSPENQEVKVAVYDSAEAMFLWTTATNLNESKNGAGGETHALTAGTVVSLQSGYDDQDPATLRWWFGAGGAGGKAGLFPVSLVYVDGSPGTGSAPPSYRYNVFNYGDSVTSLGSPLTPLKGRRRGRASVADTGTAFYDSNGMVHLWDTNEVYGTTMNCIP